MSTNNTNTLGQRRDEKGSDDGDRDDTVAEASASASTSASASLSVVLVDDASNGNIAVSKKKHKKRKAAKGQLKKLWRRATGHSPGITTRSDWNLLVELLSEYKTSCTTRADEHKSGSTSLQSKTSGGGIAIDHEAMLGPLPGPTVCLASEHQCDFGRLENWQTTEGCDHRDVLVNLLFGGVDSHHTSTSEKAQKKRKLSPPSTNKEKCGASSLVHVPPLPSWSEICNQAGVGGVAVIEIEIVGGDISTVCPLMPSQRITNSLAAKSDNVWTKLIHREKNESNKVKRTVVAACRVNLFQEKHEPRCISDILMFLPPPPPPALSDELKNASGDFDIFRAMDDLLLRPKQMRSEGFPILSNTDTYSATVESTSERRLVMKKVCELSKSPQMKEDRPPMQAKCDAIQLISALSVNLVSNDMDEAITGDEFSDMEYYVKSFSKYRAVRENSDTTDSCNVNDNHVRERKIFALDCEMVQTSSADPELARVSMLMFTGFDKDDERSVVVLDELVKPRRTVLDHLTQFSGITPNMLQSVETRIEDIQVRLLSMIDEDDIIVGHSLENDLRALRIVHDKIIDTSVLFRGSNGRKFSLKHLSNVLMQKKIQCGSHGHCSTEDAEAALVLALRRARRGDSFRLKENSSRQNIISIYQKINREASSQKKDAETFAERNDGSCVCIGGNDWISKYAQSADGAHHVLNCDSIMSNMSMAVPSWLSSDKSTKRAGLLWANLSCEDRSGNNGKDRWKGEITKLDDIMQSLVERVPTHIPILMIFQSNYKKAAVLTQQRKLSNNPKVTLRWTSEQEEQWKRCVEECRNCEAIWIGSACPTFSS